MEGHSATTLQWLPINVSASANALTSTTIEKALRSARLRDMQEDYGVELDEPRFYKTRTVLKTRKEYKCYVCNRLIVKGSPCRVVFVCDENPKPFQYRSHIPHGYCPEPEYEYQDRLGD